MGGRPRPGRTVLLTTHYMREAEELCDRIAIIDHGRLLACDSFAGLRRLVEGGQHVELEVRASDGGAPVLPSLAGVPITWGAPHPERGTRALKFRLPPGGSLADVLRELEARGARIEAIATRETSLEDVFVALVGRGLEESDERGDHAAAPSGAP
jgi:ABC-2 type transport system ATP-binding protein